MAWYDPFDIFDPGKGYKEAGKEYEKYYNDAKKYMQPYQEQGLSQIGKLNNAEDLLLDPAKLQSMWSEGYETSPYAKQLQDEASAQGMDAASSMGLLGSSAALENVQKSSTDIMNKDRQQYMDDLMKKYMAGIGIGQNFYNTGANMGSAMGQNAMNQGGRMGQSKYGQSNAMGDMMRDLMSKAAMMAMFM